MKKIISVFQRNYDTDRLIRNEVVPGAEWVLAGEGTATRKWDGACCMVENGILFKRYKLKAGKPAPPSFLPAQDPDPKTGDIPGWVVVVPSPEDKWFVAAAAVDSPECNPLPDGTYEACGPHFGGGHHSKNPEGCAVDILIPHGKHPIYNFPRTFDAMRAYFLAMDSEADPLDSLSTASIEGVVFHHPDGRMAKVKAKDFGIKRPR